jgi:hypothetical protein
MIHIQQRINVNEICSNKTYLVTAVTLTLARVVYGTHLTRTSATKDIYGEESKAEKEAERRDLHYRGCYTLLAKSGSAKYYSEGSRDSHPGKIRKICDESRSEKFWTRNIVVRRDG